ASSLKILEKLNPLVRGKQNLLHKFLSLIGVITWDLANTHSSPVARGRRVKVFVFLCCYALSRLPISLPFDFDLSISKPASLL
ncbi:conserved hypothetical protein, partial [Ricinus communis]